MRNSRALLLNTTGRLKPAGSIKKGGVQNASGVLGHGIMTLAMFGAFTLAGSWQAHAQLAISANDGHVELVDGAIKTIASGKDSLSIIDLSKTPPVKIADIPAPASVVGPPSSVAITTDERYAIVTASMKVDPNDPTNTKQIDDNRVTVIDLGNQTLTEKIKGRLFKTAKPEPRVVQTIEAGLAPAGVSVNRAGTLVLVANRSDGTVSVFGFTAGKLEPKGKVTIGNAASALGHVAITPDGKRALVTRDGDNLITVLTIEGDKVEPAKRDISAGLRPYGLSISNDGKFAAVANIGRGQGDTDTLSIIDLTREPYRVVDTISVGQTPEGVQISPDSRLIAVACQNGSTKPKASPFYNDSGRLIMLQISKDFKLSKVSETKIGGWSQGIAFAKNGRTILVQNMVEKEIQVLTNVAGKITDAGVRLKIDGAGPAGIRTADPAR